MKYFTYILQSHKDGRFYIGQSQNVNARMDNHNAGKSNYTKNFTPWVLVWYKVFNTRSQAFKLEQNLKNLKSRLRVIQYINENPCVPGADNLQIYDLIDFRASS